MNNKLTERSIRLYTIIFVSVLFSACSAAQRTHNFSLDSAGVVQAQQETLQKDAIRLQGKVISKGNKVGNWWSYKFQVEKVVMVGATFSTVEPTEGEEVELLTFETVKFKNGNEVILDVSTPDARSNAKLRVSMIAN